MDIDEYKKSMPKCKDCTGFGWGECKTAGENEVACKDFERKPKLTNADRIRQMTDEELSAFLGGIADNCSYNTCDNCPMCGACVDVPLSRDKWLKQEVKTND